MSVLDGLKTPYDVKELNIKQLKELAEEIRGTIIETTSKNGGHLSSNLGIVDTTVALYHAFDFSSDKLIFDVGHQCYAHKILSGRKEDFSTIRTDGGLSGFPDRNESVYDAFSVGHAGTSIAAAQGFLAARDRLKEDYSVINVVGDGSLVNGLNLEALFSSNVKPKNYIVILNDNGMSISKNRNGFYQLVSKSTTKRGYVGGKKALKKIFGNSFVTRWLTALRNFLRRVINRNVDFEDYGFKYVGVVDGNDMKELVRIIERVKIVAKEKAVFLHIKTTKGKGHTEAEEHSDVYHGVGAELKCESGNFSVALGEKLNSIIEKDKRVIAITAAMKDGTGLYKVEEKNPSNFFDVGIAEEYAVTLAAGMAAGGLRPVVAIYSTFLQRAYDQIVHDVCLQNLPVIFCIDRAGFVGKDGKTHQGVFDLSYLSHIPNMHIFAPNTAEELCDVLDYALTLNAPVAIRYPKNTTLKTEFVSVKNEPWRTLTHGEKVTLLAVGPNMLSLAKDFAEKRGGVKVVSARTVKPLCEKTLSEIKNSVVVTLEENSVIGGFGSSVRAFYSERGYETKVIALGVKDRFVEHGSEKKQMENNFLTEDAVKEAVEKYL